MTTRLVISRAEADEHRASFGPADRFDPHACPRCAAWLAYQDDPSLQTWEKVYRPVPPEMGG
jgi:hypothetical protein